MTYILSAIWYHILQNTQAVVDSIPTPLLNTLVRVQIVLKRERERETVNMALRTKHTLLCAALYMSVIHNT